MAEFLINSHFSMGRAHAKCEDYTTHNYQGTYVIVADGCSSSENTDIGSRLLTLAAKKVITMYRTDILESYWKFGYAVINEAHVAVRSLGLSTTCLDATLLVTFKLGNELITRVYGDGVVYVSYKDGDSFMDEISFPDNAPYYLSYTLDRERSESYASKSEGKVWTSTDDEDPLNIDYNQAVEWSNDPELTDQITIFSDGISAFMNWGQLGTIPTLNMVNKLVAFKSETGNFVYKRMIHELRKQAKDNVFPYDDISMGTILCR